MKYILTAIIIFALLVTIDAVRMRIQIHAVNQHLDKRLIDDSRNLVRIPLIGRSSIRMADLINKCLSAEEKAKLSLSCEERQFRSMIADISHDLRTPLTSIKGYLQLLDNTQLSKEQRDKLIVIRQHTDELGSLIEHFYEYSYLLSAEPQINLERFSLTNEVAECIAAAVPQLECYGFEVEIGKFEQVSTISDKEKTMRIIQNLIRNCLQHSSGNISADVYEENNFAVLTFSNPIREGDTIEITKIFDRFYTSDKSRSKSTGLGLSIVKILAEQMGGSVLAELADNKLFITVKLAKAES